MTETPTILDFKWSPRRIDPRQRRLPGDLFCLRDAICPLFGWARGSEEWLSFIEAPAAADMDRLTDHLGLDWCDPDREPEKYQTFLDHPGISAYEFRTEQMSHVLYQPHVRHLRSLPAQYAGIPAELFRIIVDTRQAPALAECWWCARHPQG